MEFVELRGGSHSENSIAFAEDDAYLGSCVPGMIVKRARNNRALETLRDRHREWHIIES